jgi:rhomboid protease GluP
MDVQHFLAVNMMVISALAIVVALVQPGGRPTALWYGVNGLVVTVGVAALRLWPAQAGWLVASVFMPLVLAPFLLGVLMNRAALKGNMRWAAALGRLLSILHPTRQVRLNSALTLAQSKPTAQQQVAALEAIAADASPAERIAIRGHILRAEGNWQGLLDHFRAHRDEIASVGSLEVRALGELGEIDQMAEAYEATRASYNGRDLLEAQLFLLAFGGRPEAVADLLGMPLAGLGNDAKGYWSAIALRAAGADAATWQAPLRAAIAGSASPVFRSRAEAVLAAPVAPSATLASPRAQAIIDNTAVRVRHADTAGRSRAAFAPFTWLMIAAMGVIYVVAEMRGGSESLRVLVDLGAMWPPYVEQRGEWWRLVTALFLHLGPLHLGVNALMLYVLGRPAEQTYGSFRLLFLYLLGGIASTGFVLWLSTSGYTEPSVLIGASGAVMAVFGAIVAHRLVSWLRFRDPVDKRALILLPAILVLQIAADLASPQVSLAAHTSGFVAGFLIGLALTLTMREHRPAEA